MKECGCKDHSGKPKKNYASYEEAEAVKRHKQIDKINISIYKCPEGYGFHLTSHSSGDGTEQEHKQEVRRYSKAKQRNPKTKIGHRIDEDTYNNLLSLRDELRRSPKRHIKS